MTHRLAGALSLALLATGCRSSEGPPSRAAVPVTKAPLDAGASASEAPHCPSDLLDVLAQHGRLFGTPAQLAALGPVLLQGELGGAEARLLLDGDHTSFALLLSPGAEMARGIDARGPWVLLAGTRFPSRDDEALEALFDRWVAERRYQSDFQAGRDRMDCEVAEGVARVSVTYKRPEMGDPVLWFDAQTKELLAARQTRSAGQPRTLDFDRWKTGEGLSFPTGWTDTVLHGHVAVTAVGRAEHVEELEGRLSVSVPRGGATFPMKIRRHHVYLVTKEGEALVDTGSPWLVLTQPRSDFLTGEASPVAGASGIAPARFGELDRVELGPVVLRHAPAMASPSLDVATAPFGPDVPFLILGLPLFVATRLRLDYAHHTLTLGGPAPAPSPSVKAVPIHLWNQAPVALGRVGAVPAWLTVDTGAEDALALHGVWAKEHGFPGSAPTLESSHVEVDGVTPVLWMRVPEVQLGDEVVTHVASTIQGTIVRGKIAGGVGNRLLGRCRAITFDVPARTLWMEGPCDLPMPDDPSLEKLR